MPKSIIQLFLGLLIVMVSRNAFCDMDSALKTLKKANENVILHENSLSPNGKYLIYQRVCRPIPEANRHAVMGIIDEEGNILYDGGFWGANISGIAWSKDSKKAAITMYTGHLWTGRFMIFSISKKTAKEELNFTACEFSKENNLTTSLIYHCFSPSFSPDEKKVLFSAVIEEQEEHREKPKWIEAVCVINTDGSDFARLTEPDKKAWLPVWSHNGKKIIYVAIPPASGSFHLDPDNILKSGKGQIWIMNADGSDKKFIAEGSNPYS